MILEMVFKYVIFLVTVVVVVVVEEGRGVLWEKMRLEEFCNGGDCVSQAMIKGGRNNDNHYVNTPRFDKIHQNLAMM